MAYKADISSNPRYCPLFKWIGDPFIFPDIPFLPRGEKVSVEGAPKIGRLTSRHKNLPNIFLGLTGKFCVSQRFKDILEELEPNVHQYVPINLQRKSGEPFGGNYYLLNVCQLIDAVIVEKSDVYWKKLSSGREVLHFARGAPHLNVSKNKVSGKHFWSGDRYLTSSYFCSDELREIIAKEKLKDVRLLHMDEE